MELQLQLQEDMKKALKAHDKQRLDVIRMLLNDVKNVDLAPVPTTPQQAVAAYAKKLKKSQQEFEKLGRSEQVQQLQSELEIVESYLPKKAGDREIASLVEAFLKQHSFTASQFGQAMGAFMKEHGENVEPAIVSQLLRKGLAAK